jgi:hypothetical protein
VKPSGRSIVASATHTGFSTGSSRISSDASTGRTRRQGKLEQDVGDRQLDDAGGADEADLPGRGRERPLPPA